MHCSSLGLSKDRSQCTSLTENADLRDDAQAITPTNIPSTRRLHKPGFNRSCPHEITSFGVPRRRTGHHDIGGVYTPSVLIAPRERNRKVPTQVCDRAYLPSDLFLCILPQASQKVDDQVHGRFARLSEEIELPFSTT
jgi:hypothetical protein